MVVSLSPAAAQSSGVTQITGIVVDTQRHPVANAQVRLSGLVSKSTVTASDGSFAFLNVPSGAFRLDISKGGFNPATQDDIIAVAGSTTSLSFTLQSASLTSLTIIGSVSVSTHTGANAINTTPASIVDVPASTFTDQGQLSVNQVLNEEPGITIGVPGGFRSNGSSPLECGVPSVRGGLPYETESLIDGHPISLGQQGFFSPSFISPYLLQNVEVVKGPGATSPSINYAINGTVNYRTLEPTLKVEESVDAGEDQYGGNFANFRATGTLPGDRLSYAFDYETQGTQGFSRGLSTPAIFCAIGPATLNGSPINQFGGQLVLGGNPQIYNSFSVTTDWLVCCHTLQQDFNERNELGKIRYAFTPSTTLTVTWLGGQSIGVNTLWGTPCADTTFLPPTGSGYTGAIPAGFMGTIFQEGYPDGGLGIQDTNLFETEFHMPLGNTATLLLRQYSSSIQTFSGGPGDSGTTAAGIQSFTRAIYGGVYFAGASTPTIFNGQTVTLTAQEYLEVRSYNDLEGYTAEIDKQAGNDLLSLSYDEEQTSTLATSDYWADANTVNVPSGSSQTFRSVMARGQFELGTRLNGTLSDNFGSYTDIYSQDAGATFQSATHTYQAPRLSLTWRSNANESIRAAVGTSIAPPYIALLNNDLTVNPGGSQPARFFCETGNSGDVLPETAFGFDVGLDTRLHSRSTVLSIDAYQTLLHNQFLSETTLDGTYTCLPGQGGLACGGYANTAPLYVTKTANLGHSEYEGVELSLHRSPARGWGYRIQGSLMRAFAYDLPAGFYNTPTGPNTTNLGILPGTNFRGGGFYSALGQASMPYSMGYGEINFSGRNGQFFLAGMTYYGPNNSYNEPAFEVVTVSYNQPLTRRTSLQLSIYNLTNAYPAIYSLPQTAPGVGILTPLANGQLGWGTADVVGPSTARLTLHVDL